MLAGFSRLTVRSTTETSSVGTRMLMPVSLPLGEIGPPKPGGEVERLPAETVLLDLQRVFEILRDILDLNAGDE